jgi:hypothetical protein
MGKISLSDVGASLVKEIDSVLVSAMKIAKKYPDLISSTKFKSLKKELEKVDDAMKSAQSAYFKSLDVLSGWLNKFPFNIMRDHPCDMDFEVDIDKDAKKSETINTSKAEKKEVVKSKKNNSSKKKVSTKEKEVKKVKTTKKK